MLCSGVGSDTSTDDNNCGACGNKVSRPNNYILSPLASNINNQCAQDAESCENGECRPVSNCDDHAQCGHVGCGGCGCGGGTACHSGMDNPNAGYCVFCADCSQVLTICASNNNCPEHNVCVQTCCTDGDFTPDIGGTPRCIPPEYLKCPDRTKSTFCLC